MSAASATALLATVGGYLVYSRLLDASQMALYSGALALARLGTLMLDGGLKVALVTQAQSPDAATYRQAGRASAALLAATSVLVALGLIAAMLVGKLDPSDVKFLAIYAQAYFATYPLQLTALAQLERDMNFGPIARAEGIGISLEYALPALLWLFVGPGLWTLLVGAWVGRAYRTLAIRFAAPSAKALSTEDAQAASGRQGRSTFWQLLRTGWHYQVAAIASLVRDNLHLLLIGPLFGKEWAGLYAWVLQMCAAASQVFVQTASRVSLPWLRASESTSTRSLLSIRQLTWLTIVTFPPVAFLVFLAPAANEALFSNKWESALPIVPFLVARMLPGIGTTVMGALVMTEQGARAYASYSLRWTAIEIALALALIPLVGPMALACSYSLAAWAGLWMLATPLRQRGESGLLLHAVLMRPSVACALIATASIAFFSLMDPKNLGLVFLLLYAAGAYVVCLSTEQPVRLFLRSWQTGT